MIYFKRKTLILLIALLSLSTFSPIVNAENGVFPSGASAKDISEEKMVYMKYDGDWDIYYYNVKTGEEKKITDAIGSQGFPAIYGDYIVWQDNRNYLDEGLPFFDIYLYHLDTEKEVKISNHKGYNQDVKIYEDKVVWIDNHGGSSNIYLYDISTDTETKITDSSANAFGVKIYKSTLVWMDVRSGSFDIYSYDLATNQEKQITSSPDKQADPRIVDNKIVYHDYQEGNRQVYLYDMNTSQAEKISQGNVDSTIFTVIDGNIVYYQENSPLIMYDVDKKESLLLNEIEPSSSIFFIDNEIYWSNGTTIKKDKLENITVSFDENNNKTTSGNEYKTENDWTVINSLGGTVKSEDNQLVIKIPTNLISQEVQIKITDLAVDDKFPITPISKIYQIDKKGTINGDIELQFNNVLDNDNELDLRKVLLYYYDLDINEWKLLNKEIKAVDATFTINSKYLTKVALGYYNHSSFNDIQAHWAKENLEVLAAHEMINGYEDQSFQPDKKITRAEVIKLIVSALNLTDTSNDPSNFSDIHNHWAASYIETAFQNNLVKGNDSKFQPNDNINRQELIAIMVRALQWKQNENMNVDFDLSEFSDEEQISAWATPYIQYAVETGLVKGKSDKIAPLEHATRAEAATVILRLLEQIE